MDDAAAARRISLPVKVLAGAALLAVGLMAAGSRLRDRSRARAILAGASRVSRDWSFEEKRALAPGLERGLGDGDPSVRHRAALALAAIGEADDEVLSSLASALGDPEETVRLGALRALTENPAPASAIPALVAAWGIENPAYRYKEDLRDAVRRMGPAAQDIVPRTLALIRQDPGRLLHPDAAAVLEAYAEASGAGAVPSLIRALTDPEADIRWRAARALGRIGVPAAAASPALAKALGDPHAYVRAAAALSLGEVGDRKVAMPALLGASTDEHPYVRTCASWSLAALRRRP